jgi:PAS domain S-box-containing protein
MITANDSDLVLGDARFKQAFEDAPIGMAIVSPDYRLLRVNASLCKALGYSKEELLSRTFVEITHPDDVKRDTELAQKLFRGELSDYRMEKRFITRDGNLAWLDVAAFVIRGREQQVLFGLAMVQNITAQKNAEAALRTSEERYRSFIVNSSEAIWRFEIERPIPVSLPVEEQIEMFYKYGYLAECNDAMARLYGHERAEDILGSRLTDFISPAREDGLMAFVSNGYRLHNSRSVTPFRRAGEKYLATTVIGIVVNGFLLRVWGTQRDETALQLAEDKLKHSREQLRSLADYLQNLRENERAGIARELHDELGQSLTALKMDLSWIAKRLVAVADQKPPAAILDRLGSASHQIEKMIAEVKNLSTELRPAVLDKFGLAAAIEWQCREFEKRSGIRTACHLPVNEAQLLPEQATALFRILQEALANVARHSQASNIVIDLYVDESDVILNLRDNGRGITAAEIAAPNSLGLLGMRERTEMLGGNFTVEGQPGRTELNVRIPLNKTEDRGCVVQGASSQ